MALLLQPLIGDNETWLKPLRQLLPGEDIRIWPNVGNAEDIEFAAVMRLPDGKLAEFPSLRMICSLLAGQDILLSDPGLPDVPIVRTDDQEGSESMTTTVLVHVLRHYCQLPQYAAMQARGGWERLPHRWKKDTNVGFLGLGLFGAGAARRIAHEGFNVMGWSRTTKNVEGVTSFSGPQGLMEMLRKTHILVNLLPLTPETRGMVNREVLGALPKGASLINLGRGAHLRASDLYWALDEGILSHATLDVFEVEPPPPGERAWTDPRITLTPHVARLEYDIESTVLHIAKAINAIRGGQSLQGLVDRRRGY
jgi:glyoxylate/hydroxypyruvate reductase